jgi:hypothetical protein
MLATATIRGDLARRRQAPWGLLAAIDLHGCDREPLEDPERIRAFVATLVDAIGMWSGGSSWTSRSWPPSASSPPT